MTIALHTTDADLDHLERTTRTFLADIAICLDAMAALRHDERKDLPGWWSYDQLEERRRRLLAERMDLAGHVEHLTEILRDLSHLLAVGDRSTSDVASVSVGIHVDWWVDRDAAYDRWREARDAAHDRWRDTRGRLEEQGVELRADRSRRTAAPR